MKFKKILFAGIGVLAADFLLAKINKPRITTKEELIFNFNAQAIPPFGIIFQNEDKNNKRLMKHELKHWEQYQKTGAIIFHLKYFTQKFFYGYDKMLMEIEARLAAGEDEYCAKNYTECVRNGTAKTIHEPDFRKV